MSIGRAFTAIEHGRYSGIIITVAAVTGLILRIIWLSHEPTHRIPLGEAENVAIDLATSGVFGDAFQHGQGPTAHLNPVVPGIAGLVYKILGVQSPEAAFVLTSFSLGLVFANILLLYRLFGRLQSQTIGRLAALSTLSVLPLNFGLEVVWFRFWDGALVALIASSFLYTAINKLEKDGEDRRLTTFLALQSAILMFLSPAYGVAAYITFFMMFIQGAFRREIVTTLLKITIALILVLTPWTIRNIYIMHSPIITRDNFGLELSLGNYAGALESDAHTEHRRRWREIHPYASREAYRRLVAAGGEVSYSKGLGDAALRWIEGHPSEFIALSLRHGSEIMFPPNWYWTFNEDRPHKGVLQLRVANCVISILGILGLMMGLILDVRRYLLVSVMLIIPVLEYSIFQPTLRYRYVFLGLLVFLSFDLVGRVGKMASRRIGSLKNRRQNGGYSRQ